MRLAADIWKRLKEWILILYFEVMALKIVSIVPIKLNNERLPGKNTKLLGDKPLIQHILQTLLACDSLNERYVFCSDEKVQEYLPAGVNFLKRPAILDEPTSNFSQIFECFKKTIEADIYVYAHATAPYISAESLQDCIDNVVSGEYDSAFTATKIQDFLWQDGEPLNFDAENLPRSQDLKPIYRESSGIYVFTKEVFEKYHRRIGKKTYIKEIGYKEAIDINTKEDFELAEQFLNK